MAISTTDDLGPASPAQLGKLRALHLTTTIVLAAIMALGVADAIGLVDAYGVNSARVKATGGGFELEVQYGTTSRPALATPFEIAVRRPGGFDGPVTIAVTRAYLKMWDENGLTPAPSAERSNGPWVEWEFDPPIGDTLTVFFDARIEPAVQTGQDGSVAVIEDGTPVVEVDFTTQVRP